MIKRLFILIFLVWGALEISRILVYYDLSTLSYLPHFIIGTVWKDLIHPKTAKETT